MPPGTRDEINARRRAHRWANREQNLTYQREQYKKHGEGRSRRAHQELRAKALAMLGGVCVQCGFSDARALQIVHGNGHSERKTFSGPAKINYNVINGVGGPYQLLCANCNWIKRAERGEVTCRKPLPNS